MNPHDLHNYTIDTTFYGLRIKMDKWFIILTLFLGTNEKEIENKRLEFLNMPFPHRHKLPLFLRYVELCPGQVNILDQINMLFKCSEDEFPLQPQEY